MKTQENTLTVTKYSGDEITEGYRLNFTFSDESEVSGIIIVWKPLGRFYTLDSENGLSSEQAAAIRNWIHKNLDKD